MLHRLPLAVACLLALCACGSADPPEAPPGAVEQVTDALERNAAVEQARTVQRIDREAAARAEASKERIEAIEKE